MNARMILPGWLLGSVCVGLAAASDAPAHFSKLVHPGPEGKLIYAADQRGNTIPDFSNCGYMGGGVRIPDVPTRLTLGPQPSGDDTARIQAAVDALGRLKPDGDGFRGALVLTRGVYRVGGTVKIAASGLVFRGEGADDAGTTIIATGLQQRTLLQVGTAVRCRELRNTRRRVTDDFVPYGARCLGVENAAGFKVGDSVIVLRPSTPEWIHDLGMDQLRGKGVKSWSPGGFDLHFERTVTAVDGRKLSFDAPLADLLDVRYGGGSVFKCEYPDRLEHLGVEDLRLVSEYKKGQEADDESHAWTGVTLDGVRNAWVRRVTALHFGLACASVAGGGRSITIEDCACLDPVSTIRGGRRYPFPLSGQLTLVQRCYARQGRHDFAMGSRVPGPNVFLDCVGEHSYCTSEPHHRWATGTLFDNVSVEGPGALLSAVNRGNSGTGHGWSGAQIVFWNCRAALIMLMRPPTGQQNFAIGLNEALKDDARCRSAVEWVKKRSLEGCGRDISHLELHGIAFGDGYFESMDRPVAPRSLYLRQLEDRLGTQAVANVATPEQLAGRVRPLLHARYSSLPFKIHRQDASSGDLDDRHEK